MKGDEQSFLETAVIFLGSFGSENALTKWLIFLGSTLEPLGLGKLGSCEISASSVLLPTVLCIPGSVTGSSTKIKLRMEIVYLG